MIEHLTKTGFRKAEIINVSRNWFEIPSRMSECFERYFILRWRADYCRKVIRLGNGALHRDGIEYLVIYHGLTPFDLKGGDFQVKLSFRKPIKEFNLTGYVLIQRA